MITRRISNSEVQTFKLCRRKWLLAWFRGLRQRHVSPLGALAVGTRVHAALAAYYVPDGEIRVDPREALDVLLVRDRKQAEALMLFSSAEDVKRFDSEADLQRIMLDGYVQWLAETGADQDYEVVAPESYVEVELSPSLSATWNQLILIIGRLDVELLHRITGARLLLDHKTTGDIKGSLRGLVMNPQMRMYRLLLELAKPGDRPVMGAVYSMLRKVKRSVRANPPFYHREFLTFNVHELESFKQQLYGVVSELLSVEECLDADNHHFTVYPTPGMHCQMCPFQRECHMFDDGSRVEDALTSRFIVGEPLSYYGKEDLARVDRTEDGRGAGDAHPRRVEAG